MSFPPISRYLLQSYSMESPAFEKLEVEMLASRDRFSTPLLVGWLLTLQCNLKCRHCWIEHTLPESMPSDRETIAARLAEANVCRVFLSGGEVTLLPEFGRYVRILKRTGTPLSIYTNGIDPVGRARGPSWLDYWDNEIDYAQVSLDGGRREEFEAQRGAGTFERFLKGVAFLRRQGVHMQARYIATPFNGADVHAAARLALDLGFEGFSAEVFYPQGRAASLGLWDAVRTGRLFNASVEAMLKDRELVESPLELGIAFPVEVPLPDFVRSALRGRTASTRVPLKGGHVHCFVMPSGEVAPITHLKASDSFRYGSLLKNSLGEIWRDVTGLQCFPRERDLSRALCAACPDFAYCRGGRGERALSYWRTLDAHDPWCHFCREGTPALPPGGQGEPSDNGVVFDRHSRVPDCVAIADGGDFGMCRTWPANIAMLYSPLGQPEVSRLAGIFQ